MKKQSNKKETFSPTEVGTLIEQLNGQFKTFGEGLSDIREKLDTVTGMVAQNSEKFNWSQLEISAIKERLIKIDGKLARIEESLKSKADRADFEILEKKVASFTN